MWNVPTDEKLAEIPRLYETEEILLQEKLIHLHFFIADCDWFVCEYDGKDLFWGFVILNNDLINAEWGYISFEEMRKILVAGFMEIDCDQSWKVRPAKDVKKIAKANNW